MAKATNGKNRVPLPAPTTTFMYRSWTKAEVARLKQLAIEHTVAELAEIFGKTYNQTYMALRHFGITFRSNKARQTWSKYEDEFLMQHYEKMTYSELAVALGRNAGCIKDRLKFYGLSCRWTPVEDNVLIATYHTMPVRKLHAYFFPDRTVNAIAMRAKYLGINDKTAQLQTLV